MRSYLEECWYNLCAWEQAWLSASCGEDNNSKKPEDWSTPCCKRMSKASSMRRGNWVRNDGGQRATLVKSPQTSHSCSTNSNWIFSDMSKMKNEEECGIHIGRINQCPPPPLIFQFWFTIAVVIKVTFSDSLLKLPAIIIVKSCILKLQLILLHFKLNNRKKLLHVISF